MPKIVKNTTIPSFLDLLAPHSCRGCKYIGNILCDCCKKNILKHHQNICPVCKAKNPTGICPNCPNLPPTFIVGNRNDLIGDLVHDYKYYSLRSLAHPLAGVLDQILPKIDGQVVIVPLPTINKHIRERGFDHTLLLAKRLSALHQNFHVENLLARSQNTIQVGSSRAERVAQTNQAYSLKKTQHLNPDITYILLDDVWTTGASMQSATKKLRRAGANKIVLALLALSYIN